MALEDLIRCPFDRSPTEYDAEVCERSRCLVTGVGDPDYSYTLRCARQPELIAMARYARHLEANETARKVRDGMSAEEVIASRRSAREGFGVAKTMERLFSGPEGDV